MYPLKFKIAKGTLKPIMQGFALLPDMVTVKDLTGLVSCKFFMYPLNEDGSLGTVKINGVAGTIPTAVDGTLVYAWTGTDTDTAGLFASYFLGYWGSGSTIPEYFVGPEVKIFDPATELVS